MIRPLLTVSTGTLASRLLGFLRDTMVAALLGAGPVADAFLVAFQGISVLRRSVTEGALNTALVPAYARVRDHDGAVAAAAFAGRVLGSVSARNDRRSNAYRPGDAAGDNGAGAGLRRPSHPAACGR